MKTHYVAGFLFRGSEVCLIRKTKPEWQAGFLNGIGGKIEENESAHQAMVREFSEEAGVVVPQWRRFAHMEFGQGSVTFFASDTSANPISVTDEIVDWFPVASLHELPVVANLRWLIPLALDQDEPYATIALP